MNSANKTALVEYLATLPLDTSDLVSIFTDTLNLRASANPPLNPSPDPTNPERDVDDAGSRSGVDGWWFRDGDGWSILTVADADIDEF